ncbi:MAG TPA: outer membrane beta-barrel protein [Candidatus Eisenbacteria bacterium]|jgi:hypothetical protein|nr:outer membrane beta-barrel protein [Candidatus Eisenbacteria bacterium]
MHSINRSLSASLFAPALTAALIVACQVSAHAFDMNGIDVKPRASVTGTYDDNVTFVRDGEIDDFVTRLSAGLEAKAEGKTHSLNVNGNIHQEFFIDNSEFDNTSGDVNADYKQEFDPYNRIRLRDSFLRAEEARTFEEAFNRTQGRYAYYRNRFLFDYMHDFTKQWSLTGRYGNEISEFQRSDIRDSSLNTAGVEALYQHTSTLKFLFAYDFSIRDFQGGSDAETHTLSTGVLYYLTKQLYAEARVGVDFIDAFNNDDFTEPMFRARLTDDINETTSWDIAFEKEYAPTSYTEDIFDYWQVSTTLRKQFNPRWNAYLSGFYGDGDYQTADRTDTLWGANVALTYDITKIWKGTVKYTFTDVNSDLASQEYTRNTIQAGLALQF